MIRKYEEENGNLPENIAMYWKASDVMWADGEQLAQIMHLIGVEPVRKDGRVKGYRIIPLEELGHPRIDVTIRVSGITRDCFYNCIELLDEAIREVAMLDEPVEKNYLRKHVLALESMRNENTNENRNGNGNEFARVFASKPGTYVNGVNLAVYASAWKGKMRRIVRSKLLNPKWIEGMKRHGYKGAGDISKRIGRVYCWEATTQEVDDWIFDEIARTFVLDAEMRNYGMQR